MRVLVTGASGLLGAHLLELFSRRHGVLGADRHPGWGDRAHEVRTGDLLDPVFTRGVVGEFAPDVVVHCAALVDVELCEREPALARSMNVETARLLAGAAGPKCLFIYISTDAVFSGEKSFWREEDAAEPLSVYARSKLEGETAVREEAPRHLAIRTNFYGWGSGRKPTFGEWMHDSLEKGKPVTLFSDVHFTPIYVGDLAERIGLLVSLGKTGLYHLAGAERVSKAEFGLKMAELAGFPAGRARIGSVEESPLKAPRAKDSSLDCSRFVRETGADLPDCAAGLRRFLREKAAPLSERFAERPPAEGRRLAGTVK